jgi:hypothetical protein
MKKVLSSSETSVLTRATWHNIPEDTILHSHCRENLKSYISQVYWHYVHWFLLSLITLLHLHNFNIKWGMKMGMNGE